LLSGFNPASLEASITVPSVTMFLSGFYTGGCVGGPSEPYYECVTYVKDESIFSIETF